MKTIEHQTYDVERSLYLQKDLCLVDCRFSGEADGESPLKEGEDLVLKECFFDLRYPLWHAQKARIDHCVFSAKSRAAFWYDDDLQITSSHLEGVKALRECRNIRLLDNEIVSPEFAWKCAQVSLFSCRVTSEYPFFLDQDLTIDHLTLDGKYSFQYVKNAEIRDSLLRTKDAFWHSEGVTIKDSVIQGEYLGWYSHNLHLINCEIQGTQPFCYCEGLVLENCTMKDADLAFEYSDVHALVKGTILSVKNPKSGEIRADAIGEVILGDAKYPSTCQIITPSK